MPLDPLSRQKKLKTVKPVEHQNTYQALYNLRENPFPALALFSPNVNDPRRNGEIYDPLFRQEEEKRFFQMFVQPLNCDRPLSLGFIRLDPQAGGRGNGKSVFLYRIMQRINQQDWEDWPSDPEDPKLFSLSVHVLPEPKKQRRFWEFVLLAFETLFDQGLLAEADRQLRAAVLLALLSGEDLQALYQRPNAEIAQALASQDEYGSLLAQYGFTLPGFVETARGRVEKIQPESNAFLENFYAHECSLQAAWKSWRESGMLGSAFQWRKNGVEWLTDGLTPILLAAGYQRLILLLDEFEKIYISQSSRERDEFLDGLRQYFYERPSLAVKHQFISTVLTIHPSIYTYVSNNWRRVGLDNMAPLDVDRIERVSVELGASTLEKLAHLLVYYIDWFRIDPNDPHRGTVYPFHPNALASFINAARYYPRGTLWYAYRLLQKAANEGVEAPISRQFVEAFIQSGEKPPQEAEDFIFQLPPVQNDLQA